MISELIIQFKELSENIETAIIADDQQVVVVFDRQISYIWNEIVKSEPSNTKDTYLLIEFLVEHLMENREIRESEKIAKHRILDVLNKQLAA